MTLNVELIRATVHAVVEAAAVSAPMPELARKYATGLMDTVVNRLYDSGVQVNHGVKNAVFRELAAIKTAHGGGPVPEWLLG